MYCMYSTTGYLVGKMASIRVQVTTYLSENDQIENWEIVKEHYGNGAGDAHVVRELIREKANDIRGGKTKRQSLGRIEEILDEYAKRFDEIDKRLQSIESMVAK